ncbi:hypothetical protein Tsubulata_044589 [Turnera subulata]|uniref:RING-type E3 ubiquitin transferase n=1 Tax=Turnera subulata TaxID=218843 RepID=A0A9Q0FII5_9ROSI|nr:hypothetical protein Tsubulata_044589 [Turnera subulata]
MSPSILIGGVSDLESFCIPPIMPPDLLIPAPVATLFSGVLQALNLMAAVSLFVSDSFWTTPIMPLDLLIPAPVAPPGPLPASNKLFPYTGPIAPNSTRSPEEAVPPGGYLPSAPPGPVNVPSILIGGVSDSLCTTPIMPPDLLTPAPVAPPGPLPASNKLFPYTGPIALNSTRSPQEAVPPGGYLPSAPPGPVNVLASVRCSVCKGNMNPSMKFINHGFINATPGDYCCNLGRYDGSERPEVCQGTIEYVAIKEFKVEGHSGKLKQCHSNDGELTGKREEGSSSSSSSSSGATPHLHLPTSNNGGGGESNSGGGSNNGGGDGDGDGGGHQPPNDPGPISLAVYNSSLRNTFSTSIRRSSIAGRSEFLDRLRSVEQTLHTNPRFNKIQRVYRSYALQKLSPQVAQDSLWTTYHLFYFDDDGKSITMGNTEEDWARFWPNLRQIKCIQRPRVSVRPNLGDPHFVYKELKARIRVEKALREDLPPTTDDDDGIAVGKGNVKPMTDAEINALTTYRYTVPGVDSSGASSSSSVPGVDSSAASSSSSVPGVDSFGASSSSSVPGVDSSGASSSSPVVTEDELKCVICLDQVKSGQILICLPCAHQFHCHCIRHWLLKERAKCPICMTGVRRRMN